MIKKQNPASEAETEVLNLITEECAEVIQIISKIARFGFDSYHPTDPTKETNRAHLETEIGDLLCLLGIASERKIFDYENVQKAVTAKREKLKVYSNVFNKDVARDKLSKSERSEYREMKQFIDAAFIVYPNLDIDVENVLWKGLS